MIQPISSISIQHAAQERHKASCNSPAYNEARRPHIGSQQNPIYAASFKPDDEED
jgi:hypothetical protein